MPTNLVSVAPLQPRLAAIDDGRRYLGGPSRSKFYADILPRLDVVKIGGRVFVTVESMDKLIDESRVTP